MKIIDSRLLDKLSREAAQSARLRKNFNLHDDYAEPCQRLLNAVERGSYIRPHRHLTPPKPETFVLLRGRMAAFIFDGQGNVERFVILSQAGPTTGIDVPPGAWHCIVSLENGSIFFETKPGPYEPLSDKEWAPWAPPEGSREAGEYLRCLEKYIQGLMAGRPT
jgi:cupin fold WbuC family metalloprotein